MFRIGRGVFAIRINAFINALLLAIHFANGKLRFALRTIHAVYLRNENPKRSDATSNNKGHRARRSITESHDRRVLHTPLTRCTVSLQFRAARHEYEKCSCASWRFGESLADGGGGRGSRREELRIRKLAGFAPRREIDGPVFPISRMFLRGYSPDPGHPSLNPRGVSPREGSPGSCVRSPLTVCFRTYNAVAICDSAGTSNSREME